MFTELWVSFTYQVIWNYN